MTDVNFYKIVSFFISIFLDSLHLQGPPLAHFENLNYDEIGGSNVGKRSSVKLYMTFFSSIISSHYR